MKKMLALVLAMMMIVSIAPMAVAQEKVTLKAACWDLSIPPYYQAMKEGYEAYNPGVTLEWVDLASQDYNIKSTAMLSGGDTTDLYCIKELGDMQNWSREGFIVNLDDMIAASSYDMTKYAGMDACYISNTDESYYALPFRADYWALFFNKDLFDAAGVAYPTNDMTWDAYAELAQKMAGEGVYGTHHHTWLSAVACWSVCDGVNTLADGEYSDLKYFYEMVQGLEDAGAIMTYDELQAAGLHYSAAFAQGNIAMLPMGYWFAATMINYVKDGTANFNWGITSVPHLEGVAAGSSFGSPTGMSISAKSEHPEESWDFISWLCSEGGAKALAANGTRAAYVSEEVAAVLAGAEGFPTDATSGAALLPTAVAMEWPVGEGVNEIKTLVNEEHTLIMTREVSIDEGLASMQERAAEFLK